MEGKPVFFMHSWDKSPSVLQWDSEASTRWKEPETKDQIVNEGNAKLSFQEVGSREKKFISISNKLK